MKFRIRMGIPEIQSFWNDLVERDAAGALGGQERKLFKQIVKALYFLEHNPRHNSLQSHEIGPLSNRVGYKIFQSYLENQTPGAGRIYWAYGPNDGEISILGIEPHPEDRKSRGYDRVRLSSMPR
ncbi:MAG: hypothetical protein ACHQNE_00980 [Candidatus Kapaibacterium sp.]